MNIHSFYAKNGGKRRMTGKLCGGRETQKGGQSFGSLKNPGGF
jgi:hypothetical protein